MAVHDIVDRDQCKPHAMLSVSHARLTLSVSTLYFHCAFMLKHHFLAIGPSNLAPVHQQTRTPPSGSNGIHDYAALSQTFLHQVQSMLILFQSNHMTNKQHARRDPQ